MGWTYDVSDLTTSGKDQIRFIIGDTLQTDPQLQDEEINFAMSQRATIFGAAAVCCRALATKFSRSVDQQAGDTKVAYSQLAKAYSAKAVDLETLSTKMGGGGVPFAGGLSVTDYITRLQNTDLMPAQFAIGMMDSVLPVPSVGIENETTVGPVEPTQI